MKVRAAIYLLALLTLPVPSAADEMKMTRGETPADQAFAASMQTMMKNMRVNPTGNPDKDFVLMMMPHDKRLVGVRLERAEECAKQGVIVKFDRGGAGVGVHDALS